MKYDIYGQEKLNMTDLYTVIYREKMLCLCPIIITDWDEIIFMVYN